MSTLALFEDGKRVEHTEYAVRYLKPGPFEARKGDVEECSEHKARWLTAASTQDELPYHGYPQHGLELVSRTVVTYYGDWHQESADLDHTEGEQVMHGHMIWKDKRIAVVDVTEGPRLDAEGVRDGWSATTDDTLAARMFYPSDMFTFEPGDAS